MVTVQHPGGWWMAQRGNGEQGWVPASYLKSAAQPADARPPRDVRVTFFSGDCSRAPRGCAAGLRRRARRRLRAACCLGPL